MAEMLVKALSLVAIIAIGYGIKRLGWLSARDFPLLSRIVLRVTLPCALATSFNTIDITASLMVLVGVGVAVNLVLQVTGLLWKRREGRLEQAFAVLNLPTYNMGAFMTPYIAGLMGPGPVVAASMFDLGNSFAAAGVGYAWGTSLADGGRRTTVVTFVRQMFRSPVFVTYLVLLVLRLTQVRLPDPIITFTSTVGAANTFLAMLMIGVGLEIHLERRKYLKAAGYLAVRYGMNALFALACWYFLPLPAELRLVAALVLFAPIASMTAAYTLEAGADVELSSFLTSVSILVSLVVLPTVLVVAG